MELAEAHRAADLALVRAAAAEAELGSLREETAVRLAEIEAELARAREQAAAPQAEVEALREQLGAAQGELEKALAGAEQAEASASQLTSCAPRPSERSRAERSWRAPPSTSSAS